MASNTVNRPANLQFKERDVNQKLQLFGIYSAFANGKVPSNQQIDVAINSALESKALTSPPEKLSGEGRKLVGDLRDVIQEAKLLLLSKNEGNLIQQFIWDTQQIGGSGVKLPGAPVDKDTAKQHGNEALEGLRTLGTLLISNGQFRKLLSDASIFLRSIAGDAASKAASKVSPSEDQLAQIDDAAADNVWHDTSNLSRSEIREQIKRKYEQQKPFGKKGANKAIGDAAQAANPDGSRNPADSAAVAADEKQNGQATSIDAAAGVGAGVQELKNQASENIPQDTKKQSKKYAERTKDYLAGKMPKERREQSIWRLKKMVVEIQGHGDYQRAVETLLRLAEEYGGHSKTFTSQGQSTAKDFVGNTRPLLDTLRTLFERFANGTSMDDLIESIRQIYRDADQDPELKGWFKKIDAYIRKCLREQGFIIQDGATDEWNVLYDQGQYLLRNKYRTHTDRIVDEFKFFGKQFDEDPRNKAFGNAVQKLFLDLGNDDNGKATFKPHLIKDLTETILPGVLVGLHYIPIPRIEYQDPMVDVVVENLVVESDNLTPNVLEFSTDNYWRWGRMKNPNRNKNKVMLAVSGVQMDLRDVSFYVKKKQGFPSLSDVGLCDIFLPGEGLSFKIEMETADKSDQAHFFKINKVKVKTKNFDIKLRQSKHKLLFSIAKPLLLRLMRPTLQKVIEKALKDNAYKLDGILYEIHQEAQKAEADAKSNPDPENVKNIYQRYWTAANQRFMQNKEKVKAVVEDRKLNMAYTQHDSIFPSISLPGGISTKATEYKELAAKGDKWESPVFSVGSAKESSDIPQAPHITRKPHSVSQSVESTGLNPTEGVTNGASKLVSATNGVTNGISNTRVASH